MKPVRNNNHFSNLFLVGTLVFSLNVLTAVIFRPDFSSAMPSVQPQPADVQRLMAAALDAEQKGRLPEAIRAYEAVLARTEGFAPAYFRLGAIYFHLGMPSKAEELYLNAIDKGLDNPDVYLHLGYIKEVEGRLAQALEYYAKGELAASKNPVLYFNMGNVQARLGQQDKSVAAFKRAVALDPAYMDALANLAIILAGMNEYQDAQYYLEKAEKLGYDAPAEFKQGLAIRVTGSQ